MLQYPSELAFLHAYAPATLCREQAEGSVPPARALRVKSLLRPELAARVRLFWADACGDSFLIILGGPQEVAEASTQVLRRADNWSFDRVLAVSPIAAGSLQLRVRKADGGQSVLCGNGARAVGRLLDQLGLARRILLQDGNVLEIGRGTFVEGQAAVWEVT